MVVWDTYTLTSRKSTLMRHNDMFYLKRKDLNKIEEGKQLFSMEGNNGGDYITLKQRSKDTVYIEVGQSCVVTIQHTVPVEWLTIVLTNAVLEASNSSDEDMVKAALRKYLEKNNKTWFEKLVKKIDFGWYVRPYKKKKQEPSEIGWMGTSGTEMSDHDY